MEAVLVDPYQINILKERGVIKDVLEMCFSVLKIFIGTILDPVIHLVRIYFGSGEYGCFFERFFSIIFCKLGEHRDACVKTRGNRDQCKNDKN